MLRAMLKNKNITMYQCAKLSGIPYTTLSEVVRGKTRLEKCSAETVYRLSRTLNVPMEDLMRDSIEPRQEFEIFKSNVCHRVKGSNEIDFIIETLQADEIRRYWNKKWHREAFYLLAMVDYLSRRNELPLAIEYDEIRSQKLAEPLYPRDVTLVAVLNPQLDNREQCRREAIPEFLRHNIIESEIENVY